MYAAIRRYRAHPSAVDLVVRRVNEDFVPLISKSRGFVAYYALHAGQGVLVSISLFDDEAGAEVSSRLAADWVRQKLGPVLLPHPPEITSGEVVAHCVGSAAGGADWQPSKPLGNV